MSDGNGASHVSIDMVEMGDDWIYFEAGNTQPSQLELPHLLNRTMSEWVKQNTGKSVRAVLPITGDSGTVGIHIWFDESK